MAKYTITHKCGHDEEISLFGPMDERERKIEWLESKPCKACKHAEDNKKAERNAVLMGFGFTSIAEDGSALPALEGTPKQVTWAEDIRNSFIADLWSLYLAGKSREFDRSTEIVSKMVGDTPIYMTGGEMARQIIDENSDDLKVTSAKAWIDDREEIARLGSAIRGAAEEIKGGCF